MKMILSIVAMLLLTRQTQAATQNGIYIESGKGVPAGDIQFSSGGGKVVLTFTHKGEIIVASGVKPDKAAREFLKILREMYPNLLCEKPTKP